MQSIYNHSKSDADFLVNLYKTDRLTGNTAKKRTDTILELTWSGPYQHFTGEYGDSGFKESFSDNQDQVGHFLTAVRTGIESNFFLKTYLIDSAVIGHEMIGNRRYEYERPLSGLNHAIQILVGLDPVAHVLFNIESDITDNMIINKIPSFKPLLGLPVDHTGNSKEDLRLTRAGIAFGSEIQYGNTINTNQDAALWLQNNICKFADCSK